MKSKSEFEIARRVGRCFAAIALGCLVAASAPRQAGAQSNNAPPLKITASLSWDGMFEDDPLRVRVRLSCPQASRAVALQVRLIEAGQPPGDPVVPPAIATNWQDGVQLSLYQADANQNLVLTLGPEQWPPYLRPLAGDAPAFEGLPTAQSREWMLPDTVAGLTEGSYAVTVAWNGTGLTDTNLLPADGVLHGQDLPFDVTSTGGDDEQATHLGRLAFQHYFSGDYAGARNYGQQAIQLDPSNPDRERIQTYFVVAHSALYLDDYLGGANTFESLVSTFSSSLPNEAVDLAAQRFNQLAPILQVPPASRNNLLNFRFQLLSLPGQRYVSYSSTDLQHWMPFTTNVGTGDWVDVIDTNPPPPATRFYRSVLTP